MARLTKSTCLFKVTYKHSSFFFPTYSFFIENEFLFPMIHPDHSFPSIHSPRVFPTLPLPPFHLQKKSKFPRCNSKTGQTKIQQDKAKAFKPRQNKSTHYIHALGLVYDLENFRILYAQRLCKGKGILLQTNPLSNQEIRYKIYHEANLRK